MTTQRIVAIDHGYEVAKRVRAAKQWFVRCGDNVVGPVSIELLERGLEAGKIPADAEMTFEGSDEWRCVADVFAVKQSAPPPAPPSRPMVLFIPPAPPSVRYAEDPICIPKQGMVASLFG